MKILTIFGTRPEAIKMAPLIRAMQKQSQFNCQVCLTAQHREMLDQMLTLFEIEADYDLNLMQPNQTLSNLSARILSELTPVLEKEKPDWVLVQGDTTTTSMAAYAAFLQKIPVAHLEAGLRTDDIYAPFPEEVNRRLTTTLSRLHLAPTENNAAHLLAENIHRDAIVVTGNTVIDALLWVAKRGQWQDAWESKFKSATAVVKSHTPFILVTGHRRESFGDGFQHICQAIAEIANKYPNMHIIYPVHLNPNVQQPVKQHLSNLNNVHLIEPLDYEPFVYLLKQCHFALTDSGGVQEEAPSLGKPVLVMREKTERTEAISAGTAILVGVDKQNIVTHCEALLNDALLYEKMSAAHNPYGDGHATEKVLNALEAHHPILTRMV